MEEQVYLKYGAKVSDCEQLELGLLLPISFCLSLLLILFLLFLMVRSLLRAF